jgi:hypothetical protein
VSQPPARSFSSPDEDRDRFLTDALLISFFFPSLQVMGQTTHLSSSRFLDNNKQHTQPHPSHSQTSRRFND